MRSAIALLREIDLERIHASADAPVQILLVGAPQDVEVLRGLVSAGASPGVAEATVIAEVATDVGLPSPERSVALLAVAEEGWDAALLEHARGLRRVGVALVAVSIVDGPPHPERARHGYPHVALRPAPGAFGARVIPVLLDELPEASDLALALARRLPVFRREYARRLVEDTARANAWYALSTGVAQVTGVGNLPLALADTVVLSKNQLVMAYKIALASGRRDRPHVLMRAVVGVLGGGLLFRQIARQLVGLVPVFGLVPKVAVAYSGTRLVGVVVQAWALEGRRIQADELRLQFADAVAAGRRTARALVRRRRAAGL